MVSVLTSKGAKPFWFPCITKQSIDSLKYGTESKMALYKITSPLNETQSGYSQSITMTWEEVYSGIVNMPDQSGITIKSVTGRSDRLKCTMSEIPSYTPAVSDFSLSYSIVPSTIKNTIPINRLTCENDIVSITFDKIPYSGTINVFLTYKSKTLSYSYYN